LEKRFRKAVQSSMLVPKSTVRLFQGLVWHPLTVIQRAQVQKCPLGLLSVEYGKVPEHAFALTAARLGGKPLAQSPRHKMFVVPILNNSVV
jgi:hypothetical protein